MSVFTHKTGGFETIHLLYGIRKEKYEICTYYYATNFKVAEWRLK